MKHHSRTSSHKLLRWGLSMAPALSRMCTPLRSLPLIQLSALKCCHGNGRWQPPPSSASSASYISIHLKESLPHWEKSRTPRISSLVSSFLSALFSITAINLSQSKVYFTLIQFIILYVSISLTAKCRNTLYTVSSYYIIYIYIVHIKIHSPVVTSFLGSDWDDDLVVRAAALLRCYGMERTPALALAHFPDRRPEMRITPSVCVVPSGAAAGFKS